ncbi:MAG: hypothetical protein IJW64_02060 [Clostridia bacterium]|nr:hypothetical protein [Clostridia bacterium]
MYAYEKTILETYGQTEAFIKSTRLAIKRGALASYYSRKPVEQLADEIIKLKLQLEEIEALKNAIDESLLEIKPCYSYFLKVRYGILDGKDLSVEKDSHYYRMVAYALGKFVSSMRKRGYSGEVLNRTFQNYVYLQSAYKQISNFETKVKSCGNLKHGGTSLKNKKIKKEGFKKF